MLSAGSACHAGQDQPPTVLTEMGLTHTEALETIRISLGRWTTAEDIDEACDHIAHATQ